MDFAAHCDMYNPTTYSAFDEVSVLFVKQAAYCNFNVLSFK